MVDYVIAQYGRLDVLHNSIGIGMHGSILNLTDDDWHRVMATNRKSMQFSGKYAIPRMIQTGEGAITDISSVAADRCLGLFAYVVTKGGAILSLRFPFGL